MAHEAGRERPTDSVLAGEQAAYLQDWYDRGEKIERRNFVVVESPIVLDGIFAVQDFRRNLALSDLSGYLVDAEKGFFTPLGKSWLPLFPVRGGRV